MDRAVYESVSGLNKNYILPFLGLYGEEELLLKKMENLYACGVRELCVTPGEGPAPDGQAVMRNFEAALAEAERKGMRLWIRDDLRPEETEDSAAGEGPVREEEYLFMRMFDATGPLARASFDIAEEISRGKCGGQISDGKLLTVTAMRMSDGDTAAPEAAVDGSPNRIIFTDCVSDGKLVLSLPRGVWRIFVVYTARAEGVLPAAGIRESSVQFILDHVYEVFYKRYGSCFGGLIAGFLSDAPQFRFLPEEAEGTCGSFQPVLWHEELPELLAQRLGDNWRELLPLLLIPSEDERTMAAVRYAYTDAVSAIYAAACPERVGAWCRARNVEYLGFAPEDSGGHSRIGCGTGHFFRSVSGLSMAGIAQPERGIVPGNPNTNRLDAPFADGQYFHYAQIKLAASAALLQQEKEGRVLCSLPFGNGCGTGVRDMKWIADYLIANGVNRLAFRAFPDGEGPEFMSGSLHPEFPYFVRFMNYCSRICHIFSGGKWVPEVGILYHGEMEWMGSCMMDQVPARKLKEGYIDYAFIPADALADATGTGSGRYPVSVSDGKLVVNGVPLKLLIVPGARFADQKLIRFMETFPEVRVVFTDVAPRGLEHASVVPLDELVPRLRAMGVIGARADVSGSASFFHYVKDSGDLWMAFNESRTESVSGTLLVKLKDETQKVWKYDVRKNCVYPVEQLMAFGFDEPRMLTTLHLGPYESAVFFTAAEGETEALLVKADPDELTEVKRTDISGGWSVEAASSGGPDRFVQLPEAVNGANEELLPVSELIPGFSGRVRYSRELEIPDPRKHYMIEAEHFYEAGRVMVNGEEADCRICPRYRFDLPGVLKRGTNRIEIELAGSMAAGANVREGIREPVGMFGKIWLLEVK